MVKVEHNALINLIACEQSFKVTFDSFYFLVYKKKFVNQNKSVFNWNSLDHCLWFCCTIYNNCSNF
jgi:hypothetical protein